MLKLVVLSALVALASAGAILPLAHSTVISPGFTSISESASSVVHPSPTFYYGAPALSTAHVLSAPIAASPYAYATHLIKKRSPIDFYRTPLTYSTPVITSPYYSSPVLSPALPYLSAPFAAAPFGYAAATHLIKK